MYITLLRPSVVESNVKLRDVAIATDSTLCPAGSSHSMLVTMPSRKSVEQVSVSAWPTVSTPGSVILTAADERVTVCAVGRE